MAKEDLFNPIEEKQVKGWFDGKKMIPFSEMSDEYLQAAHGKCQNKEREYNARAAIFNQLQELIEEEALKREVELKPNSKFAKNNI